MLQSYTLGTKFTESFAQEVVQAEYRNCIKKFIFNHEIDNGLLRKPKAV